MDIESLKEFCKSPRSSTENKNMGSGLALCVGIEEMQNSRPSPKFYVL